MRSHISGKSLSDEDKEALLNKSESACQSFKPEPKEQKQEDTSDSEQEESQQQDSELNQAENQERGKEDRDNS